MRIRDFFLSRRYGLFIFITLLLLFALVLMSLRAKQRRGVEFLDALLMEVCSPLQKAATLVVKTGQGIFYKYIFLVNLEKENRMLRQKIVELQEENLRAKEVRLALDRLKQLLQFRQTNSPSMIGAEVIRTMDRQQIGKARTGAIDPALDCPDSTIANCRCLLVGEP